MRASGWLSFLNAITSIFLLIPIIVIVLLSFSGSPYLVFPPPDYSLRWYRSFLHSPEWRSSVVTSLEIAALSTSLALGMGIPAAFALTRGSFRFRRGVMWIITIPMIFPIVVSAVAVYYVFGPMHLVGTKLGLALAHACIALPVVVLPFEAVLHRFDERLEWQALTLGASRTITLKTVTLPLLWGPIAAVSVFAFMTSFDEIVYALFLGTGGVVTLPKRVWEGLRFDLDPTVTVVAAFLAFLATLLVACSLFLTFRSRMPKGML